MPGVVLVNPNGEREYVFSDQIDAKRAEGYTAPDDGSQVTVRRPSGSTTNIAADDFVATHSPGESVTGGAQQAADYSAYRGHEDFGGVGGGLQALGLGVARGASFGLSDYLFNKDNVEGFAAENPGLSFAGEIGGSVAFGLGSGLSAGAAELGAHLAPGSKAAASLIAGGVEGFGFGAGQAAASIVLKNEPLTAESVFTELGTDIFLGVGAGAVGGLAGHGLEQLGGRMLGKGTARLAKDVDPEGVLAANAEEATAIPFNSERGRILTEDFVGGISESVKVADDLAAEVARRPVIAAEGTESAVAAEAPAVASEAVEAPKSFEDLPDVAFTGNYTARNLIQQMDQSALDATELAVMSAESSPKRFGHLKENIKAVKDADSTLKKLINHELEPGATGPNSQEFGTGATKGRTRLHGPDGTADADIPAVKKAMQAYHDAIEALHGKLGIDMPNVLIGDDFHIPAGKGTAEAGVATEAPGAAQAAPVTPELKAAAAENQSAKQVLLDKLYVRDGKIASKRTLKVIAELPFNELTDVAHAYSSYIKSSKALAEGLGTEFAGAAQKLSSELERAMGSVKNLVGGATEATPDATKQLLVSMGLFGALEAVPDFDGPADDIVKMWLAAKLAHGGLGTGSVVKAAAGKATNNVVHSTLEQGARRAGARVASKGAGSVLGGFRAAAGSRAAGWAVEQILGSTTALAKATSRATGHAQQVVGQMLKGSGKALRRAAPFAPQAFLKAVKYADIDHAPGTSAFDQRAREIRLNVANSMGMQHTVLRNLGELAMHHPGVADKVVYQAKRTMDFLQAKLPRDPGTVMRMGRSGWKASEQDQAKFARYARAAADPDGELSRFAEGDLSPEGAETLRVLYPAKFAKFQEYIAANLNTLADKLSYPEQVQMSVLFNVPVTSLMRPEVIRQIQANFTADASSQPISAPPPGGNSVTPLSPAQQLLTR